MKDKIEILIIYDMFFWMSSFLFFEGFLRTFGLMVIRTDFDNFE